MAMSSGTLSTQLQNLAPAGDEPTAIGHLADAWHTYFSSAQAGAVPYAPSSVPRDAMAGAMTGLSTTGSVAIQAGVTAYWVAVAAGGPVFFPTATLVTPAPGLAGIAAALVPVFLANTLGSLDLASSCSAIATVLHPLNLGGTATLPGPVVTPIT